MADPAVDVDRHPGVQRRRRDRRGRARAARGRRRGTRSSSSTTDRPTTPAARAAAAGATVVRHPYNKGNGAAVKTGIRRATGEYVLIVDGDGQHRPSDALRLVSQPRRVRPRRRRRDRGDAGDRGRGASATPRSTGWRAISPAAHIPDLTSGFRAARRDVPARVPAPAAERLLDADDDDAGVHQGGLQRARSSRSRRGSAIGHSKIRLARDGAKFFLIILRVITIFSPLRIFLPISARVVPLGVAYGVWNVVATQRTSRTASVLLIMFAVIVFLVGLVSEQISALRFEGRQLIAADRRGAAVDRRGRSPACVLRLAFGARLLDRQAADARRARVPGARRAASPQGRGFAYDADERDAGRPAQHVRPRARLSRCSCAADRGWTPTSRRPAAADVPASVKIVAGDRSARAAIWLIGPGAARAAGDARRRRRRLRSPRSIRRWCGCRPTRLSEAARTRSLALACARLARRRDRWLAGARATPAAAPDARARGRRRSPPASAR